VQFEVDSVVKIVTAGLMPGSLPDCVYRSIDAIAISCRQHGERLPSDFALAANIKTARISFGALCDTGLRKIKVVPMRHAVAWGVRAWPTGDRR
jgi:uncharacterized SAM-binding protein YcdF (DUF218 family)